MPTGRLVMPTGRPACQDRDLMYKKNDKIRFVSDDRKRAKRKDIFFGKSVTRLI